MGLWTSGIEGVRDVLEGVEGESVLDVNDMLLGRRWSFLFRVPSALIDMPDFRGFERVLMTEV